MALVLEKPVAPGSGRTDSSALDREDSRVAIFVIYTSVDATVAALQHAGALVRRLDGRISLLVSQIVQQPTPLTSPPVLVDWNENRFRTIAQASPVDVTIRVCLCRDRDETLLQTLPPRSLVVIGAARRIGPFGAEKRLARKLLHAGHEVVLVER
jgi:hypothetical protein